MVGASAWHHFVRWDPDISAALARLHQEILASGNYRKGLLGRVLRPKTIEQARARAGEDGTHSALDVDRVVDTPLGSFASASRGGVVAPMDTKRLREVFGNGPHTRPTVARGVLELLGSIPRGTAVWIAVMDEHGTPVEICFAGKSGD